VDIDRLQQRQRHAHLRFRVLGVLLWLGLIAAGVSLLVSAVPQATIVGWALVVVGVGMLALRIVVLVAVRRSRTSGGAGPTA
jgi:hypothetical protein